MHACILAVYPAWKLMQFNVFKLHTTSEPLEDCKFSLTHTHTCLHIQECVTPWPLQGQLRHYAAVSKHAATVKFGNELHNISINDVRLL